MGSRDDKSVLALGFVTILEHPEQGLSGGFLLLNPAARPLEFHCTAPVRATRAQQILYGRTLRPYLYGEQIAATLVKKANLRPVLIVTDQPHVLAMREHVDIPTVLVPPDDGLDCNDSGDGPPAAESGKETPASDADAANSRQDAGGDRSHAIDPEIELMTFLGATGPTTLSVLRKYSSDRAKVEQVLEAIGRPLDLREPMHRIREAIREAHRGPRRAA
jgi:hypothetical protein